MEVLGGGAYFFISRALGPEFGGSIGVLLFIGNILGAAMSIFGFMEPLLELDVLPDSKLWILLYSSILLLLCLFICLFGSKVKDNFNTDLRENFSFIIFYSDCIFYIRRSFLSF